MTWGKSRIPCYCGFWCFSFQSPKSSRSCVSKNSNPVTMNVLEKDHCLTNWLLFLMRITKKLTPSEFWIFVKDFAKNFDCLKTISIICLLQFGKKKLWEIPKSHFNVTKASASVKLFNKIIYLIETCEGSKSDYKNGGIEDLKTVNLIETSLYM